MSEHTVKLRESFYRRAFETQDQALIRRQQEREQAADEMEAMQKRIMALEAVAEQADRAVLWQIRNGFLTVEDKALLKRLRAAGYPVEGEG